MEINLLSGGYRSRSYKPIFYWIGTGLFFISIVTSHVILHFYIQKKQSQISQLQSVVTELTSEIKKIQTEKLTTNQTIKPLKNAALINLDHINITDALQILAKLLRQNIVISPYVKGTTALHLHGLPNQDIFNLLLISHHLNKQTIGNTWFITSQADYEQRQQANIKIKNFLEETIPLKIQIFKMHYAKAEDLAQLLQDNTHSLLSKRGHVHVDTRTNSLCIEDTVERLTKINNVMQSLDVPVPQVLIETRLASIDNDYERELGLNFAVTTDAANQKNFINTLGKKYSLAIARLPDNTQLDVQLAALENSGHGELISSPSLFTANQQSASIESGEEIPYQEVSESGGTAVTFKKAVLSLKVTPQIMPNNKILLHLQVNQDRPNNRVVMGVPAITTRQITTHVVISNGKTVVLGGIYEFNNENSDQGVPYLNKIPLVGLFFKQQNIKSNKRELLIFVTPKIIT